MAKILVVGDDPAEQEVLGLVIEFGGHCCKVAVSQKDAVNLLKRESFDLLIADFKLDWRRSRRIVKGFKSCSAEIAVMILTKSGDTAAHEADEVMAMPCSPDNLLQRIEQVLRKAGGHRGERPSQWEEGPSVKKHLRRATTA